MKMHESPEDYLETILILSEENESVRSIDIATHLGFSKPSVSVAMKKLKENGFISMDPYGKVMLTDAGHEIASKVYERHQVISGWLTSIGVSAETALKDACRIEHVISDESFAKLKELYVRKDL
ncbi:MAG: metal-dependent transcriptional regulator [Thermoflexaceae bacterium]|nr:metal-dependent transcriptional regulator [Thermoflexaceae bacterium]